MPEKDDFKRAVEELFAPIEELIETMWERLDELASDNSPEPPHA